MSTFLNYNHRQKYYIIDIRAMIIGEMRKEKSSPQMKKETISQILIKIFTMVK